MKELPNASEDERQYAEKLGRCLIEKIDRNGGAIPFSHYFNVCLYHDKYGYYTNDLPIFGRHGDFVTAPLISPYFTYALANQIMEIAHNLDEYSIVEIGAGNGVMAKDLLLYLQKKQRLPKQYYILEISATLQRVQQETLAEALPEYSDHIIWLREPPTFQWKGVILANEVIDALAVERFTIQDEKPYYIDVGYEIDDDKKELSFCDRYRMADANLTAFIDKMAEREIYFEEGYCSEYCPYLSDWLPTLFEHLERGVGIFIDYGYHEEEYYRPERDKGTLIAHYRHRAHEDFYLYPGLQDLTANVNFTQLAEEGSALGLVVLGYTTQNFFLHGNGLATLLLEAKEHSTETEWYTILHTIQELVMPNAMGERFKVMALGKDYDVDLQGFSLTTHEHLL